MDSFQTPTNNAMDKCYMLTVVMLSHYNQKVCILYTLIKKTPYILLHKNKCQYVMYKNRLYAVHINRT